jgi:hypothetical protein
MEPSSNEITKLGYFVNAVSVALPSQPLQFYPPRLNIFFVEHEIRIYVGWHRHTRNFQ